MDFSSRTTGLLILRVWREGAPNMLRARLLQCDDLTATVPTDGLVSVTVTTGVSETVRAVECWLVSFAEGG